MFQPEYEYKHPCFTQGASKTIQNQLIDNNWEQNFIYYTSQLCIKLQIKTQSSNIKQDQMSDKTKLIESMSNLIQQPTNQHRHVSFSRRNQQQIFSTLSATDIKKILSNLQDSNQKLRKTTLLLLAELLYDNSGLQKKFCQLTGIPQYSAKIVFNSSFPKPILHDHQSLSQVVKILKDKSNQKQNALFWYIDVNNKPKILQYGNRNIFNVDPLNSLVGIWILGQKGPVKTSTHAPTQVQNKNNAKSMNHSTNGKVRLIRSQLYEKDRSEQNINQLKNEVQLKTPSKTSTGQQLLTQSGNIRQNNYVQVNKNKSYHIQTQSKPISKTENVNVKFLNSSERKNYPLVNNFNPGITNGHDPTRMQNMIDPNTFRLGINLMNSGFNISNNRIPQTTTNRGEKIQGIKTMEIMTPNSTMGRPINQEMRQPFMHSFQQFRKK